MAAHQVGVFVDDVTIEDELDSYPPGCHAYVTDLGVLGVRFNTNLENDYEVDYFYAMICTEKPNQPNYHGM